MLNGVAWCNRDGRLDSDVAGRRGIEGSDVKCFGRIGEAQIAFLAGNPPVCGVVDRFAIDTEPAAHALQCGLLWFRHGTILIGPDVKKQVSAFTDCIDQQLNK